MLYESYHLCAPNAYIYTMRIFITAIVISFVIFSCAPSRIVKPLKKNEKSLSANFGGPLIGFSGTTIPIPFTAISYAQGICDNTSAFGSVHTTAMLFGNFQTDLGICQQIWKSDSLRIGISCNPVFNVLFDKWEKNLRFWPQLDFNFYYEIKANKNFVYSGIMNWFELSGTKAHHQPQKKNWLPGIQAGYNHQFNEWSFTIEAKWIAPSRENKPNVIDYKGISGKGATGIYFGFTRKLTK